MNPADQRGESDFFPRAAANAETRGEAAFAPRKPSTVLGAGTVLTAEQVKRAYRVGAKCIASPGLDRDEVEESLALGMAALPGAPRPRRLWRH